MKKLNEIEDLICKTVHDLMFYERASYKMLLFDMKTRKFTGVSRDGNREDFIPESEELRLIAENYFHNKEGQIFIASVPTNNIDGTKS